MGELTNKQKLWLEEYLQCWNATEAARKAGYKNPRHSGYENRTKPYIEKRIRQRLRESAMSADEVLSRLAEQARGTIADFIDASVASGIPDLTEAREKGLLHLMKSISWTKQGMRIELYDAQAALVHLGRHHGLFKDQVEITWREGLPEGITPDEASEAQRQFAHMMAEAADKHDDTDTTNHESD